MAVTDQIALNFNPENLKILNVILGVVMFGIALDMKVEHFRKVLSMPKPVIIGLFAQFFALPALTFCLVLVLQPDPAIALGLMLVAACPGGNLSNFITHLAGGNTALSVSMSAISTMAATVMTPFNIALWGGLYAGTAPLLRSVELSPVDMMATISVILLAPLLLGLYVSEKKPLIAEKIHRVMKIGSIVFFVGFIFAALLANLDNFLQVLNVVAVAVFLHNAMAISAGYGVSRLAGLQEADCRAVSIEVGIQNSGLGLILIFNFFDGMGGMAVVAAWWGVWHGVAGLSLAAFWSRRKPAIVGA